MFIMKFFGAVAGFASVAFAAASTDNNRGFAWTGQVHEKGPNVTLTGTIEVLELNPSFRNATREGTDLSVNEVYKFDCNAGAVWGLTRAVWEALVYFRTLTGTCSLQANDVGGCGRVSCSWGTGVMFCNDRSTAIEKPCYDIGDMVEVIYYGCNIPSPNGPGDQYRKGGAWDDDGTHVIVDGSHDC